MQTAKLGNLWVSVSIVANSATIPLTGDAVWLFALAYLAQSPYHLILPGIMALHRSHP